MRSAHARFPNREIDFGFGCGCVACVRAKLREGVRDVDSPGAKPADANRGWCAGAGAAAAAGGGPAPFCVLDFNIADFDIEWCEMFLAACLLFVAGRTRNGPIWSDLPNYAR